MQNLINHINSLPDLNPAGFADTALLPDLDQATAATYELTNWEYTCAKQDHLTSLLRNSGYGSPFYESIMADIDNNNMGEDEYYTLLADLQNNQMDPISHSGNLYSQGDIKRYLRRFM